jgi:hypothetical protein
VVSTVDRIASAAWQIRPGVDAFLRCSHDGCRLSDTFLICLSGWRRNDVESAMLDSIMIRPAQRPGCDGEDCGPGERRQEAPQHPDRNERRRDHESDAGDQLIISMAMGEGTATGPRARIRRAD